MEQLRCVVERITFTNEENGYTVIKAKAKNYSELITVVGNMAVVNVGAVLTVRGNWKTDGKYGRQFICSSWEEILPATVYGIEKYLGSGLVKGVGPKFAKRVVAEFGIDTLRIIEDEPDKLLKVDGIGAKRVATIKKAWEEQKEIKNIMLFLQEHNVSTSLAVKIFKTYGGSSISIVKDNPYKLTDDIWGVGFKTADSIAVKMGFDRESCHRCRSGLFHVLNEFAGDGHCYMQRDKLIKKASEILGIEDVRLNISIDNMLSARDLVREEPDSIYLMPLFHCENGTSRRLRKIMSVPRANIEIDLDAVISELEKNSGVVYHDIQREAIRIASRSKIMVLTGGPGTGKTTATKGIIAAFVKQGLKVLLAAPTGRAAKRLSETSAMEAKTLHRLLESKPPQGYAKNSDNPLDGDALIVDESSMIDIVLMYNLLKAVPDSMIVVFVGDADQLPSVGPGNVLRDLIESEAIPVVKLTQVFRQAQNSRIIMNAHRVIHGVFPNLKGGKDSDFFYIEENEPAHIPTLISDLCVNRLPRHYKISPSSHIQVLSPMQRGETGAANLNRVLQNAINPNKPCLFRAGTEYRLGDKVMQIKNNYEKEIFNGDSGIITGVNTEDRTLTVTFDSKPAVYDITELDELVLAYATTIHKAQGSEYPIVIMPVTMQHYLMLQRNLLYTAITRAKKIFIMVGTKKAIGFAVRSNAITQRNTGLAARLSEPAKIL